MASCNLVGTVKAYDGSTSQPGTRLYVHKVLPGDGSTTIFGTQQRAHTLLNNGTWSPLIQIERKAVAYISLNAPGFDRDMDRGTPLQIPDASEATLQSLAAPVSLPSQVPVLFPAKRLVIVPTPDYDLASNVLAVGLILSLGADRVVAVNKVLDLIRLSETNGGYIVVTLGADAQAAGLEYQLQADADSHASSNLHGVLGVVSNKGSGTAKGLYGRAKSESGSTGPAIGGVFAVEARSGAINWILQMAGTDDTDAAAYIHADNFTEANFNDGIVFAPEVRMENGGAFLKAFQTVGHDGDFLRYLAQGGATLFVVNKAGKVTTYNGDTTAGNGVSSVVARVALTNRSTAISATNLFTPPADSLYKVTAYEVVTTADTGLADKPIDLLIEWEDDAQPQSRFVFGASTPTSSEIGAFGQGSTMVRAKSGTQIKYSTTTNGDLTDGRYALFITVERVD